MVRSKYFGKAPIVPFLFLRPGFRLRVALFVRRQLALETGKRPSLSESTTNSSAGTGGLK